MVDNEELNNLYCSSNIVRVVKSRRMRWAIYVARRGEMRGVYRVFVWKPERRDNSEEPGIDGRIMLRWSFRKWDGSTYWINLARDRDRWKALV